MTIRKGPTLGSTSKRSRQEKWRRPGRSCGPGRRRDQAPGDEQAGQHEPRQEAGDEQPADRGLGGDAVDDHGDRGRDQDAQGAAGRDRAGRQAVGIAALAHLGHAHLADGGAGRRRGAGERGEDRAGADVGDHQPARHPVQPAVQRLVEVGAGPRGGDGAAHQDEHRDRQQGEVVEPAVEDVGHDRERAQAVEDHQEENGDEAQGEGHRCAPTAAPATVTTATIRPRAKGLMARPPRRPKGGARPVSSASDVGDVLQAEQADAERHGGPGDPEPGRPDRLAAPAIGVGLVPPGDPSPADEPAEGQRQ